MIRQLGHERLSAAIVLDESHAIVDQDLALSPEEQHDPFERRLLTILRRVVTEVGVRSDLSNLGIDRDTLWSSFEEEEANLREDIRQRLNYINLARLYRNRTPSDEAIGVGELTHDFTTPEFLELHPFLLGVILGARIRRREGLGERHLNPVAEGGAFLTLDIVDLPLQYAHDTLATAVDSGLDSFKRDYLGFVIPDVAEGFFPPLGFTRAGFYAIVNCIFPYVFFVPPRPISGHPSDRRGSDKRDILDDATSHILKVNAGLLFKAGVEVGVELRAKDRIRYRPSASFSRRPRGFLITHGYDLDQFSWNGDGWDPTPTDNSYPKPKDRSYLYGEYTRGSSESADASTDDPEYHLNRHADYLAWLSAQGNREFSLWHLFSNLIVGDFVLLMLRPFSPISVETDINCGEELATCLGKEGRPCAVHLAESFSSARLSFPGCGKPPSPPGTESTDSSTIFGVGLVTLAPNWFRGSSANGVWQGNLGFVRPLPVSLTVNELNHVLPRKEILPSKEREMAYLQFDSKDWRFHSNVSFNGKHWHALLERLNVALKTKLDAFCESSQNKQAALDPEVEFASWRSDLKRLQLCSSNLTLGASIESLSVLAPDFHYPATLPPPNSATRDFQDNSRIWFKSLSGYDGVDARRDGVSPLDFLPGVISRWDNDRFLRSEIKGGPRDERIRNVGKHETHSFRQLLKARRDDLNSVERASFGLVVSSVSHLRIFTNLLGTNLASASKISGGPASSPDLLVLPLDPAWLVRRPIWRFSDGEGPPLYFALIYPSRAEMEASVLQTLLESKHGAESPEKSERFKMALGLEPETGFPPRRPLGLDSLFADDPVTIRNSIDAFTS